MANSLSDQRAIYVSELPVSQVPSSGPLNNGAVLSPWSPISLAKENRDILSAVLDQDREKIQGKIEGSDG